MIRQNETLAAHDATLPAYVVIEPASVTAPEATDPLDAEAAETGRIARETLVASLVDARIHWGTPGRWPYRDRFDPTDFIPYHTTIATMDLMVRVNDFPAEPMYTLIMDGTELAHLEDWPTSWRRPD